MMNKYEDQTFMTFQYSVECGKSFVHTDEWADQMHDMCGLCDNFGGK